MKEIFRQSYPQKFFPHSTSCVEKFLQAGIDIGGNIPNVVLNGGIAGFQLSFHIFDGV